MKQMETLIDYWDGIKKKLHRSIWTQKIRI